MENLIRHIDYLMSRNDCVIIPGIGALLARYVGARADLSSGIMYPPHREFSFNSALVYNDGLLAHSYARELGISYDSAVAKVNDAAGKLDNMLRINGTADLGRIGTLAFNNGTLDFTPAADTFALSYLPAVSKVAKSQSVASSEQSVAAAAGVRLRSSWSLRQVARIAASIALMIGICFIASTPIKVDDAALASLSPEFKQATIEDIMAVDNGEVDVTYTINVIGTDGNYLAVDGQPRPVKANSAAKRYYLIVASFYTATEANKFIEMHGQQDLGRLDSDSRYRVYAGVYDNADAAIAALNSTSFRASGAWISHQ